jgi:hypothetical protein
MTWSSSEPQVERGDWLVCAAHGGAIEVPGRLLTALRHVVAYQKAPLPCLGWALLAPAGMCLAGPT